MCDLPTVSTKLMVVNISMFIDSLFQKYVCSCHRPSPPLGSEKMQIVRSLCLQELSPGMGADLSR